MEPRSPALQADLYQLSHKESPRILVAYASPLDLPDPGMELRSPTLQTDSSPSELHGSPLQFHYLAPSSDKVTGNSRATSTQVHFY